MHNLWLLGRKLQSIRHCLLTAQNGSRVEASVIVNADRSNTSICVLRCSVWQNLEKMLFMYRLLRLYSGNYLEVGVVTCRVFVVLHVLERLLLTHTHLWSTFKFSCFQAFRLPWNTSQRYVLRLKDLENLILFSINTIWSSQ